MDVENQTKSSSVPISGRAKRTRVKASTAVVRKGKTKKASMNLVYDMASPVVTILIGDSFPSCDPLAKKSLDMLNYDVGWNDETGAVSQSIEVEGQDDLTLHAHESATHSIKAIKARKSKKCTATHPIEVEGQDDLASYAHQSAAQPVNATKTQKSRKRKATLSTEVEKQDEPVIHTDNDATEATNVSPTATKARKRRKRVVSPSVEEGEQEDSAVPTDHSSIQAAKVSPAVKVNKGKKRAIVDVEGVVEPIVWRNSSSKRSFKWTPEQDKHLKTAVEEVKSASKRIGMWERIAERMQILSEIPPLDGFVFKGEMCRTRWSHYVGPMQKGLIRGGKLWKPEEVKKLQQLVTQHTTPASGNKPAEIHWNIICDAEHMHRIPQECRNKWYEICDQSRKQGPFSAEENLLILRSVATWAHPKKKTGLWVSLGNDLDRPSKKIRDHWRCNLLPKYATLQTMVKDFFIQLCIARMEYKQIYQRLSEEPLVVLEQVLHDVSEIYQSRVQQNILDNIEQRRSKEADASAESEGGGDHELSSTADSIASSLANGSDSVEAAMTSDVDKKTNTAAVEDSEKLKNLDVNAGSKSDHSDKATSEDEAESTAMHMKEDVNTTAENVPAQNKADQEETSYRLRIRPTAKKVVSRMYGTIVGAENLTKPPLWKGSRADSTAAPTRTKWTTKLIKRLVQGVELYQGVGWDRVAEYVGGSTTAQQCLQRWRTRSLFAPAEKIKRKWSNAKLAELARLAKLHVIPSQWSESQQTMLPERVDWFHVAQVLERTPKSCYNKHNALQSKMKA